MQRRELCIFIASATIAAVTTSEASQAQTKPSQEHVAWVLEVLTRMKTIKPGMTRKELLTVFTTEGGMYTGLWRTFVSRDCPYFKVNVEFEAVGRPGKDAEGRHTGVEDDRDVIVKISDPYLGYANFD